MRQPEQARGREKECKNKKERKREKEREAESKSRGETKSVCGQLCLGADQYPSLAQILLKGIEVNGICKSVCVRD